MGKSEKRNRQKYTGGGILKAPFNVSSSVGLHLFGDVTQTNFCDYEKTN